MRVKDLKKELEDLAELVENSDELVVMMRQDQNIYEQYDIVVELGRDDETNNIIVEICRA